MRLANSRLVVSRRLMLFCACVFALCYCALTTHAQDAKQPQLGFQPGHAYAVGDFETINTTNGNLMLHFPLGSLPAGRGGLSAGITLLYNSKIWGSGHPHGRLRRATALAGEVERRTA